MSFNLQRQTACFLNCAFGLFLNYVFCISFLCWFHFPVFFLGAPAQRVQAAKHERAESAKVGPCLTDAAPKAALGALSVKVSRYAKARTSTSAVAAACCSGGVINTSSTAHVGRSASIQAGEVMIIPIMWNVKNWSAAAAINHAT
jgi:hypothetical protein